jgi:hypothetical protein
VIPTIDDKGRVAILVYNYIDQQAALNYLSRNLSRLDPAERNTLLGIIKSDIFAKLLSGQAALESLNLSADLKKMLEAAMGLNRAAEKYRAAERNLKINLSNLQGNYLYQRYAVDAGCNSDCAFEPAEEKHISAAGDYQDTLLLKPYSVNLVIFSKEELPVAEAPAAAPAPAATPAENPAPEKKEPADKPAAPADKPEVPVAQAP